jgi:hypothetical protein
MQFVVFIVHSSMDPPVHPLCVEPPKFQISQICTLSWNSQAKSKHPLPWVVVHGGGGGFYNGYTDRPPTLSVVKHMRQLVAL